MTTEGITFVLNGETVTYQGSATARLLDALRDDYRLTGVKCGCREGECGACAVILDGELHNSCMVAMGRLAGAQVMTIEGYRKTKRFQVLDKAYEAVGAVQCGYCIPGMVLASECLLARNPRPDEAAIRAGISGNLCRCTGYNAIAQAIGLAAKEGEGLW
jgi:carbon-monoxide dehydrogenase small subunit